MPWKDPETRRLRQREAYRKNPKKKIDYVMAYRAKNPEKLAEWRKIYGDNRLRKVHAAYRIILEHYGNKCETCGTSTGRLCIDHINGIHPEGSPKDQFALRYWLIENNFPPGFRILCNNCNIIDGLLRATPGLNIQGIDELISLKRGSNGI